MILIVQSHSTVRHFMQIYAINLVFTDEILTNITKKWAEELGKPLPKGNKQTKIVIMELLNLESQI